MGSTGGYFGSGGGYWAGGTAGTAGATGPAGPTGATGATGATGPAGTSPTTTKGDLIVRDASADARLAVGSNTQVLTADSTTATGVKWAAGGGAVDFSAVPNGTVANPGLGFVGNPTTGFSRPSAGQMSASVAGTESARFTAAGGTLLGSWSTPNAFGIGNYAIVTGGGTTMYVGAQSGEGYIDVSSAFRLAAGGASRLLISAAGAIGFFGSSGTTKPTVTGAKGSNAALADLLTKLAALGLLTDSSTA